MRYFFSLLAAVLLVAGVTKVGYDRFEDEIETGSGSPAVTETTTTLPSVLPNERQVVVTGIVTTAHLESTLLPPLNVTLAEAQEAIEKFERACLAARKQGAA